MFESLQSPLFLDAQRALSPETWETLRGSSASSSGVESQLEYQFWLLKHRLTPILVRSAMLQSKERVPVLAA
jgi:hypothetical protein